MAGTPIDASLIMRAQADLSATTTTTAIDVEGGSDAECFVQWTGQTGTSPTLGVTIEASMDGGSTYKQISGGTRTFTGSDDPASGATYYKDSFGIYIPKPTGTDSYRGSGLRTKVRAVLTLGGTTPVFQGFLIHLGAPVSGSTAEREAA